MAGRIRTIKPELLEDERTASLSDAAFRLFVGSILLADDYGNLRASPAYIMGAVGASAGWDMPKAAAATAELQRANLLTVYSVRGQRYAAIRSWDKHQRVDKPGKPRCPNVNDSDSVEESQEFPGKNPGIPRLTSDLRPPTPTSESDPEGDLRPLASPLAPPAAAPAQASDRPSPKPKRPRAEPTGDHHEFIRRFDALYAERTGGQMPLWDGKTGRHVAELLKRLPLTELVRRTEKLFRDPPHWLAKDVPTMGTLYSQINALADDARPPVQGLLGGRMRPFDQRKGGLSGDEIRAFAQHVREQKGSTDGND